MNLLSAAPLVGIFGGAALFWASPAALRPWSLALTWGVVASVMDPAALPWLVGAALAAAVVGQRPALSGRAAAAVVAGALGVFVGVRVYAEGGVTSSLPGATLPLGLAYVVPRLIHLAVERWRGGPALPVAHSAAWVAFFPALVAGPIHPGDSFSRDLRRTRWDPARFSLGCERIVYGYARMVVLGSAGVPWLVEVFGVWVPSQGPRLQEGVACVAYGLNLYLQFSGYSEIALGAALLVGVHLPENFERPYLATSLPEFWRRWHITLSQWCRSYVYTPVAAMSRSPALAVVLSMLVLALWHEFSWRYLLWGCWHGGGLVVWQVWQHLKGRAPEGLARVPAPARAAVGWALTQGFVLASFALTRAETEGQALANLRRLLLGGL